MEQTLELTREQMIFYKGKRKLEEYDRIMESRELTIEEKENRDRILEVLLKNVLRFGIQEAHKMLGKYNGVRQEAYADVTQELSLVFFEKLPEYDPLRTTPTTFFRPHFRQVIAGYIRENITHLKQYDSLNSKKVLSAITSYDARGIKLTEDMLATKTGLSVKVVRATLSHRHNANYVALDDDSEDNVLQVKAPVPTPEESILQMESETILTDSIKRLLTQEEQKIFLLRVNMDGRKEKSYEEVSDETGLPVREVKKIYNRCICKLRDDEELTKRFKRSRTTRTVGNVRFQDQSGDILEQQIIAGIS